MNDSRYHIHHHRFDHRRLYASFLSCRNASHGASRPLITMPDGEIDIEAFLKEIDEVLGVADTEDEDEGMAGHHLDDSMYEDQSYPN
ncbi:hypothetical protein DFQ27_001922 [Actinomortierella ambigua]|uniref:Uncharacterized protein n=1 Tax=Actinomortierella ambigua TaxID=1343610 RepID=A0A9P6QBP2_9FUNG|nr:hypothetical protein DFQ27_001922 [Actinomortierella ambigua]